MRALSLEYHDVVDEHGFDASGFPGAGPASYKLTGAEFDRHLDAIGRIVRRSPSRAPDWLDDDCRGRPLFLTFDDGGLASYTHTADALERHGWRGHFFVTAKYIGAPAFLSGGQIRELSRRGHVIGSHSYSHPMRMGACTRDEILDEWVCSVGMLTDTLGEPVVTASVPGGYYTPAVAEASAQAGLKLLFTSAPTTRGWTVDGCRVVGRYTMRRWSRPQTAAALADGRVAPRTAQWLLYRSLHALRTLTGDHYTRLRQRYWATRTV